MAIQYEGIRILMVRAHYPELEENLVQPMLKWLPHDIFQYNGTSHLMTFDNGSIIKFGHWDGDDAEQEYQGVEYDVIFLEEATQLSERAFQFLQTCVRGTNDFPKRMYLTANPGGVGHLWVKRLFIDRKFRTNDPDPERNENPADYTTIRATVEDNPWLMKKSPMYVKNLANLPEDLRRAHRYGDWDALGGAYFKQFSTTEHVIDDFNIPKSWNVYRAFDYGFDMFACCWFAVDQDGRSWCFREVEKKGLVVQDAARTAQDYTAPSENVIVTYAPPDMWNRQKENGKAMAELFALNGLPIVRASNNRVQGHMIVKDMLKPMPLKDPYIIKEVFKGRAPEKLPGLMFFSSVQKVISDISAIQADDKNPNDCAKQPHEITHTVDAVRYYCVNRVLPPEEEQKPADIDDEEEVGEDYEHFMCGDEITEAYMNY